MIIDFLELDGVREALALVPASQRAVVAAPRVIKPSEDALWRVLLTLQRADALLVRGAGLLMALREAEAREGLRLPSLRGDASLNVANADAARALFTLLRSSCGASLGRRAARVRITDLTVL